MYRRMKPPERSHRNELYCMQHSNRPYKDSSTRFLLLSQKVFSNKATVCFPRRCCPIRPQFVIPEGAIFRCKNFHGVINIAELSYDTAEYKTNCMSSPLDALQRITYQSMAIPFVHKNKVFKQLVTSSLRRSFDTNISEKSRPCSKMIQNINQGPRCSVKKLGMGNS